MKRLLTGAVAAAALLTATAACGGDTAAEPAATPAHQHPSTDASTLPLRDGERFIQLTMARPVTPVPPSGGSDEYRC